MPTTNYYVALVCLAGSGQGLRRAWENTLRHEMNLIPRSELSLYGARLTKSKESFVISAPPKVTVAQSWSRVAVWCAPLAALPPWGGDACARAQEGGGGALVQNHSHAGPLLPHLVLRRGRCRVGTGPASVLAARHTQAPQP